MIGKILLAGTLLLLGTNAAAPPRQLYKRAACNRDNLFRCFIDERYSIQAADYCSGLSPSTVTVATTIETITTIIEERVTVDAVVSIVTSTTTVFTETIPTATTTLTLGVGNVAKRDNAVSPPKCMTNGVTYPASRITSACSCIDVPASTISVTHTAGTETVTHMTTAYATPSVTITSWETVSTDTTDGIYTVTVGPPAGTDRLINGNFETGNLDGWEMLPEEWTASLSTWNASPLPGTGSLLVTGSGNSLGILRQVLPVYIEAGQYRFEVISNVFLFPLATCGWGQFATLDLINPVTGTNITAPAVTGSKAIVDKAFVCRLSSVFTVPESAAGYNQVSIRYLSASPPLREIDGISLQKL